MLKISWSIEAESSTTTTTSVWAGGRAVHDATARVDVAAEWGVDTLPSEPGLDVAGMLSAIGSGELQALVVGGLEPRDFADAGQVREALESAGFVISLETRLSEVT